MFQVSDKNNDILLLYLYFIKFKNKWKANDKFIIFYVVSLSIIIFIWSATFISLFVNPNFNFWSAQDHQIFLYFSTSATKFFPSQSPLISSLIPCSKSTAHWSQFNPCCFVRPSSYLKIFAISYRVCFELTCLYPLIFYTSTLTDLFAYGLFHFIFSIAQILAGILW